MLWCKTIIVVALFASFMSASEIENKAGDHYYNPYGALNKNTIQVGQLYLAHEDGQTYEKHNCAQRYRFGYKIIDKYGNKQAREEESDEHNNRKGYYSFIDNEGIHRKVKYIADRHGFRATVITNEPGTASSHPAEAKIIISQQTQPHHGHNGEGLIDERSSPTTISKDTTATVVQPPPIIDFSGQESDAHIAEHVAHLDSRVEPYAKPPLKQSGRTVSLLYHRNTYTPHLLATTDYPRHEQLIEEQRVSQQDAYPAESVAALSGISSNDIHRGAQHSAHSQSAFIETAPGTEIPQANYVRGAYYASPDEKLNAVTSGYRSQTWF